MEGGITYKSELAKRQASVQYLHETSKLGIADKNYVYES